MVSGTGAEEAFRVSIMETRDGLGPPGDAQARDPRAMPLRYAEKNGGFEKAFLGFNEAMASAH